MRTLGQKSFKKNLSERKKILQEKKSFVITPRKIFFASEIISVGVMVQTQ